MANIAGRLYPVNIFAEAVAKKNKQNLIILSNSYP